LLLTKGMRRPSFHVHHQMDWRAEVQSAVDARRHHDARRQQLSGIATPLAAMDPAP
jgi:hypothetical protein